MLLCHPIGYVEVECEGPSPWITAEEFFCHLISCCLPHRGLNAGEKYGDSNERTIRTVIRYVLCENKIRLDSFW